VSPEVARVDRRFEDIVIDTVWSRGSLSDTVIELPLHVRADGDLLLISDVARRGVAALRTADGTTAWTLGRAGRGPGEFRRPSALEVLPDGRVLVADTEVGRVTILDRAGAYLTEFPLEEAQVSGMCALEDGTLVAVAAADDENISRLSLTGEVLGRHAVPWPELVEAPMLARQLVAATATDRKACYVALSLGRGFTAFDGSRFLFTKDFVERVQAPAVEVRVSGSRSNRVTDAQVRNGTIATRSIAASSDLLYVVFEGSTEDAARIVDVYTRAGEYDHSFRLPGVVHKLTWSDDTFYVLSDVNAVPVVTALRIRRRT
jgi:sugar lactone lactonase YvrE